MMRLNKYFIPVTFVVVPIISGLVVGTGFVEAKEKKAAKQQQSDGMSLYKTNCATCHGDDGKPTELGEGLGSQNFTDAKYQASITDDKMIKQITDGSPEKMISFKDTLKPEEIKALVQVIRGFAKK